MGGKGCYANPLLSLVALSDGSRQKTEVATFIAEDRQKLQFDGIAQTGKHLGIVVKRCRLLHHPFVG